MREKEEKKAWCGVVRWVHRVKRSKEGSRYVKHIQQSTESKCTSNTMLLPFLQHMCLPGHLLLLLLQHT